MSEVISPQDARAPVLLLVGGYEMRTILKETFLPPKQLFHYYLVGITVFFLANLHSVVPKHGIIRIQ